MWGTISPTNAIGPEIVTAIAVRSDPSPKSAVRRRVTLTPAGLAVRRRMNQEIAAYMLEVVNRSDGHLAVTPDLAMAVVGGIHELVLQAIEDGKVTELAELTVTATQLVKAVVHRT